MDENRERKENFVDTTDCIEAVGVCRGWKNFLAVIIILCLLPLQASFWLVDTGYVKAESGETDVSEKLSAAGMPADTKPVSEEGIVSVEQGEKKQSTTEENEIEEAAKKAIVGDPTDREEKVEQSQQARLFRIQMRHLFWVIRFCNFIIILASVLYCLTLLFSFKVSLIGRLGGINHICRAFFISLVLIIFLMPWQKYFNNVVVGAIYTPDELIKWCSAEKNHIFYIAVHYLRFSGYWLLILLLLIFSQWRSSRWAKAILRRLEAL